MSVLEHLFVESDQGVLVPGIHTVSWSVFRTQFGTNPKRNFQIEGMILAMRALKLAGCKAVYIDGSFTSRKVQPGDYDALWDEQGVNIDALDPTFRDFAFGRKAQKEKFLGEWFPMHQQADQYGTLFIEYFQFDRENRPKGIIRMELEVWDDN